MDNLYTEGVESKEPHHEPNANDPTWTDFGLGCGLLLSAGVFFISPWYFLGDPFPAGLLPTILAGFLYLVGLAGVAFGLGSFSTGFQKTPELRALLPRLRGGEDAWQGALGTVTFLAIALILHVVVIWGFGVTGVAAGGVKLLIVFLGFLAAVQMISALDGFVIRPLIESAARGPKEFEPLVKRAQQVGTVIGFLIATAAGIATIVQVLSP